MLSPARTTRSPPPSSDQVAGVGRNSRPGRIFAGHARVGWDGSIDVGHASAGNEGNISASQGPDSLRKITEIDPPTRRSDSARKDHIQPGIGQTRGRVESIIAKTPLSVKPRRSSQLVGISREESGLPFWVTCSILPSAKMVTLPPPQLYCANVGTRVRTVTQGRLGG